MMKNRYHILMADVIGSRDFSHSSMFIDGFRSLVTEANKKFKTKILSPLTITLGDEFQGIIGDRESAFDIIYFLNETIYRNKCQFKLRYSIVYGEIDTSINSNIAYNMYGQGLTDAREGLSIIKNSESKIYIKIDQKIDRKLTLCFKLYNSITSEWRIAEYAKIDLLLKHRNYKVLMEKGYYQSASGAWKKMKALKIDDYFSLKELIFAILET